MASGTWESTVVWLEWAGEEELVKVERTFYSFEERSEFIQARIDMGAVYDVLSMTESATGGPQRADIVPVEETAANGFWE